MNIKLEWYTSMTVNSLLLHILRFENTRSSLLLKQRSINVLNVFDSVIFSKLLNYINPNRDPEI